MKISCPSCAAKYSITDEKVRDRLAKIRCRKCGTTIVIDGKVDPPNVTAAAPIAVSSEPPADAGYNDGGSEAGPEPGGYSVDMGDDDQRSMSVQQIVDAYRRGEISDTTYVWADGMIDWQRVADVAELSNALGLNPSMAPPPSEPVSRAATRSGTGRGSAADLFGGIESAGSEDDVTTSAPEPIAATAATGARNESSVLFSLSALTGSATPTAPLVMPKQPSSFPSKPSVSNEDSGLIDLKALTATVNAPGFGSDAMASNMSPLNLGAPPIGMAAPLGGVGAVAATDNTPVGRESSGGKSAMVIGGAILVVGLAIAGVLFATHGGSDETKAEPATAAAAPVVAAPQPTQTTAPHPTAAPAVKTAEAVAAPPPTGTAAASVAPPAKSAAPTTTTAPAARAITGTVAKHKTTSSTSSSSASSSSKPSSASSTGSSSSASSSPASSAPSEAPAEPKKKKCDCKPSDLMCAMKCSAK